MKSGSRSHLQSLRNSLGQADDESQALRLRCLRALSRELPLDAKGIIALCDALLFICAHPAQETELELAQALQLRLARHLRVLRKKQSAALVNQGLPWMPTRAYYSHDCLLWLLQEEVKLTASTGECRLDINDIFRPLLPTLERSETTAGYNEKELFEALGLDETSLPLFLAQGFNRMAHSPLEKDLLYEALDPTFEVLPQSVSFSRPFNQLSGEPVFFHTDFLRRVPDVKGLLNEPLPPPRAMSAEALASLIRVIRTSLALLQRETDPVTYMDESSLRFYDLGRGLSVALYGMQAQRQLPLESYIGYTLFKNGFPAAYGGAWVFGERALFGINIFEWFRGGESGFMFCQLLRAYRQSLGVDYFEVEPYQYGLDNPEGIASGAFWFYHRHGFRPVDKALAWLAEIEHEKIRNGTGYRSSEKTLLRFTESNLALSLGPAPGPAVTEWLARVRKMIQRRYRGDRDAAEAAAFTLLLPHLPERLFHGTEFGLLQNALTELGLLALTAVWIQPEQLQALAALAAAKPAGPWEYQRQLLAFLQTVK